MKKALICGSFAVVFLASTALAQSPGRVVTFGDSLSDTGNLFALTGVPPAPYSGGRFSNGPVWNQQLFAPAVGFSSPTLTGNVNFAFGGSRTDVLGPLNGLTVVPGATFGVATPAVNFPPGIPVQIDSYLNRGGRFSAGDLVTVWGGANNIIDLLRTTSSPGSPATNNPALPGFVLPTAASISATAAGAATDIGASVSRLAAAGAGRVVVLNLPDLGIAPGFNGTAASSQAASLGASTFNTTLRGALNGAKGAAPGLDLIQVDVASVFTAVVGSPGAFGFANVSDACIAVPGCVGASTATQNTYLFWDGVHPTTAGHALVAQLVNQYLMAPVTAASAEPFGRMALADRRSDSLRTVDRLDAARLGLQPSDTLQAEFIGGRASGDSQGVIPSWSQNQIGLAVGMVRSITTDWTLALGGAFYGGPVKSGVYKGDSAGGGLDIAATYMTGPWFATVAGGIGTVRYSGLERTTLGPLKNTADTSGWSGNIGAEAGVMQRFGAFSATAKLRLGWIAANLDSFTEAGIVAPIAYRSRDVSAGTAGGEVRFAYDIMAEKTRTLSVYGLVGYDQYFSVTGDLRAELANNTALPFSISPRTSGPGVSVGAGLSGRFDDRLSLTAEYRAVFGEHGTNDQRGRIGVNYRF